MAKNATSSDESARPFLTDVQTLRERSRRHLSDGAVTATYKGDVKRTIEIPQTVLATEIVCVLRYPLRRLETDCEPRATMATGDLIVVGRCLREMGLNLDARSKVSRR